MTPEELRREREASLARQKARQGPEVPHVRTESQWKNFSTAPSPMGRVGDDDFDPPLLRRAHR